MIKFKDINIPKPCSVDYNSLTGDEVKRFCGNCEKHVYDFREKDEAYLNEVFRSTGKACGIYYEDQIQKSSLKIQRPFHYALATRLVSIGLFLKTFLSTHNTEASFIEKQKTTQESIDSTGLKVKYKEKNVRHQNHRINVYVNDVLYVYDLNKKDSVLYLPDSIQPNDKIKVIVEGDKRKIGYRSFKTKTKEYNFIYNNSEKILIEINCKSKALLFKKRRRQVMGKMRAI